MGHVHKQLFPPCASSARRQAAKLLSRLVHLRNADKESNSDGVHSFLAVLAIKNQSQNRVFARSAGSTGGPYGKQVSDMTT